MPQKIPKISTALDATNLPLNTSDIATAWLSTALDVPLNSSSIASILPGTATKIFLEVDYADESDGKVRPNRLCLKGGFDESLRELGLNTAYRREAEFFAHLAPKLPGRGLRVPRALYSGTDRENGQGIVIFEDLREGGYSFSDPTHAWPPARVAEGLAQLAILHAATWGAKVELHPWLKKENAVLQNVLGSLFTEEYWRQQFETDDCPAGVPEWMKDRERMWRAFEILREEENAALRCVVHGDPHAGNTFIGKGGEVGFVDWQVVDLGSAMHDVAYFLSGALSVNERRVFERELLEGYLTALENAGGPRLGIGKIWGDYRMHLLHGFVWVLTCPRMQTKERVDSMSERHIAAIEDHATVELLESFRR